MKLKKEEIDLVRQWFNCLQDVNPKFLESADYELSKKIYDYLKKRAPNSARNNP